MKVLSLILRKSSSNKPWPTVCWLLHDAILRTSNNASIVAQAKGAKTRHSHCPRRAMSEGRN